MQLFWWRARKSFLRHSQGIRDFRLGKNVKKVTLGVETTADILFRFSRIVESKVASYRENVGVVIPISCLMLFRHFKRF